MKLAKQIRDLLITTDADGNKWYPSGYLDEINKACELAELRENELLAQIEQFVEHGYLDPKGEMTSINFDGCKRLFVKKDKP